MRRPGPGTTRAPAAALRPPPPAAGRGVLPLPPRPFWGGGVFGRAPSPPDDEVTRAGAWSCSFSTPRPNPGWFLGIARRVRDGAYFSR